MKQTKQEEENCILSMHSYVKNVLFTFVKQSENILQCVHPTVKKKKANFLVP